MFEVAGKYFKLSYVDPYGESINIIQTNESKTNYYFEETPYFPDNPKSQIQDTQSKLNQEFWEYVFETMDENKIIMKGYKGKYLLLNFWGEWCAPCVAEIPSLVKTYNKFPRSKLVMISVLNSKNQKKAKEIINSMEMNK